MVASSRNAKVTEAEGSGTANWWQNATTLGPAKKTGKDAMVRCKLAGSERFTRVDDCLAAGGSLLQ